ncbi:MAG: alanine racemase, partial [Chitinophagaceae bacterium]|nr:alanine racemase [Chitinophagaceae bacterium]
FNLINTYRGTVFSCIADNKDSAGYISESAIKNKSIADVFIDVNTGMNRTGIGIDEVMPLFAILKNLKGIRVRGLHAYDGHIRDTDIAQRQIKSDEAFGKLQVLRDKLTAQFGFTAKIVIGGSPTFPTHVKRENVECSPGTFVFWDHGYKINIPDQPFDCAALVLTRIISIVDERTVCTDLGYKSVSSENPLPRVYFLNAPDAEAVAQNEEHLVLKVKDAAMFKPGDVLYGVPQHICPTVALYEKAVVVEDNEATGEWNVIARNRKINI